MPGSVGDAGRRLHVRFTDTSDGDLAVDADEPGLAARRAAVAPGRWTWLQQVHGARVVVVDHPGQHAGVEADAAVTSCVDAVLAVQTADCAPVLLAGWHQGDLVAVGAAHAGWRGLHLGVLERTVEELRALGATEVQWRLGACISPDAYEFGEQDLDVVARRLGPEVRSRTRDGRPALDLRAGVRAALAGVDAVEAEPGVAVGCTASDARWYSYRARRDAGRQSGVTWMSSDADPWVVT